MTTGYWQTLEQRLTEFWKPGQEIVCLRIFRAENSQCELCDKQPITWNHVLINRQTGESMKVGSHCVNNFQKVIDKLDADANILFLDKHRPLAGENNNGYSRNVINFDETVAVLAKILDKKDLKYKTVESILKFASDCKSESGNYLFQKAIEIYADNYYYLIDSSGLTEKEYNDPKIWAEYCLHNAEGANLPGNLKDELYEEVLKEDAAFHSDYSPDDEGYIIIDDDTPEGLGLDEVDWDSNDTGEK